MIDCLLFVPRPLFISYLKWPFGFLNSGSCCAQRGVYPRIYRFPCDVFKVKSLNTCWICVVCFIHLNWNWTRCFITRETLLKSVAVTQGDVVTRWQYVSSSWCSCSPCYHRKLVLTDICTLCNSCVNRHKARIVSWGEVFCEQHVMQQNCGVTRLITFMWHFDENWAKKSEVWQRVNNMLNFKPFRTGSETDVNWVILGLNFVAILRHFYLLKFVTDIFPGILYERS